MSTAELIASQEAEIERLRAEFDRVCSNVSDVYCQITGGVLSKPGYDARTVLIYAEEYARKCWDEETAELQTEHARLRAKLQAVEALICNDEMVHMLNLLTALATGDAE